MTAPPRRSAVLLLVILATFSLSARVQTSFKAAAVNATATVTDGLAQVSFKLEVTNDGPSPMTNVVVVFADNTEINVGDVAAEATVTTDQHSRTIDVAESITRSIVIQVTVKYAVDGENIETPWTLSVVAE